LSAFLLISSSFDFTFTDQYHTNLNILDVNTRIQCPIPPKTNATPESCCRSSDLLHFSLKMCRSLPLRCIPSDSHAVPDGSYMHGESLKAVAEADKPPTRIFHPILTIFRIAEGCF